MMQRTILITVLTFFVSCSAAQAELRVRDICRVKGQEENTLHGLGLVVGLEGTGDGDAPTTRALAKFLEHMGSPLSTDANGVPTLTELKNARNVALTYIIATVPAEGARQGSAINCSVNAVSAKSLQGGVLIPTVLRGPNPNDTRVYAIAQGPLTTDKSGPLTSAKVHGGCRLEVDVRNPFLADGKLTLVLDKSHAGFNTAYDVEEALNSPMRVGTLDSGDPTRRNDRRDSGSIAKAIDQANVEVTIPAAYAENSVQFIYEVLETPIQAPRNDARVVVNERNGVIVIGAQVEIGSVAVTHKNLSIQAGNAADIGPFVALEQNSVTSTTKLQALVDALNALKVETTDIIDIIKGLERSGDLYGHVVTE
jgi:flagellar P-ring protein precursor FlgI